MSSQRSEAAERGTKGAAPGGKFKFAMYWAGSCGGCVPFGADAPASMRLMLTCAAT